MKTLILSITSILLSFNVYSQSFDFNKEYKCKGGLYLLTDDKSDTDGELKFNLILNNNKLIINENKTKHVALDYEIKFLKGQYGLIVTPKTEKHSITFTLDLEEGIYKYNYTQSDNYIYNQVISIGECK